MEKIKDIDKFIEDALMGRPYAFSVSNRQFYLYPPSLGKLYLLHRCIEEMEMNNQNLLRNFAVEALIIAKRKKVVCLRLIYYFTCKSKWEVFDAFLMEKTIRFFEKNMGDEDIASLVIVILSSDKTQQFINHLGITKELERMNVVQKIKSKKDKNNLTFGGKTQFGALLDVACERYGWTKDYVVWDIDYSSLRLMLADKINTVYVSDDEWKRLPARIKNSRDKERINGDDRNAVREAIKSQKWD